MLHGAWRDWSAAWGVAERYRHAGVLVLPQGHGAASGLDAARLAEIVIELVDQADDLTGRILGWNRQTGWQELP